MASETSPVDPILCPECGSEQCLFTDDRATYRVCWECPECGARGSDGYEDLYGAMAVPWGFLL